MSYRKHGNAPYSVVVVHGGPGAAGEMAPVAKKLCDRFGVLEPFQTRDTVQGQVDELKAALETEARTPAVIVGYSWGAWLCVMLASKHPELVEKLVLVGSGPFEARFAENIGPTRMNRLSPSERDEIIVLEKALRSSDPLEKTSAFAKLGKLISKADTYESLVWEDEIEYRPDIFESVWPEAVEIRRSGGLLDLASRIKCPVCAIHGDHDPHPAEGVEKTLAKVVEHFRFILLDKCGHKPWVERNASRNFIDVLVEEIDSSV